MTIRHNGNIIAGMATNIIPVGTILPYAGATAPEGYLLCNGQAVSRTTYSALFTVIGTTYGEGDGNTTFNLPSENDFSLGIPSDRYKDLTLDVSGSEYIAPANGYFFISKQCNGNNQYCELINTNSDMVTSTTCPQWEHCKIFLPVKKNDVIQVNYNAGGTLWFFRFVYVQGQSSIVKY